MLFTAPEVSYSTTGVTEVCIITDTSDGNGVVFSVASVCVSSDHRVLYSSEYVLLIDIYAPVVCELRKFEKLESDRNKSV